jgi:hypothetical protein
MAQLQYSLHLVHGFGQHNEQGQFPVNCQGIAFKWPLGLGLGNDAVCRQYFTKALEQGCTIDFWELAVHVIRFLIQHNDIV